MRSVLIHDPMRLRQQRAHLIPFGCPRVRVHGQAVRQRQEREQQLARCLDQPVGVGGFFFERCGVVRGSGGSDGGVSFTEDAVLLGWRWWGGREEVPEFGGEVEEGGRGVGFLEGGEAGEVRWCEGFVEGGWSGECGADGSG